MSEIVRKEICECVNCGNEAEMLITCTLEPIDEHAEKVTAGAKSEQEASKQKVKGSATCSHCGNEADMWIDL
jgi:transcription elongation factor Elf1